MQKISVKINGKALEIPANATILGAAERLSGISLFDAIQTKGGVPINFVLGVVAAGAKRAGLDVTYEQIGETCDMNDAIGAWMQIVLALVGTGPANKPGESDAA